MKKEFSKNNMFSYNLTKKRFFLLIVTIILIALAAFVVVYLTVLRESDFIVITILKAFFNHIILNIKSGGLLGAFYTSLFGGLFFVFMPMEVAFIAFIKSGSYPALVIALYVLGMFFSFTINYYIGMKLTDISKKIITPRKFYKIKTVINKYGALAIFVFNVLPLPAQPLSAILGVFKYNKARFYFFFILGQTIKYTFITIGYFYII
ncbi:MAG: hypothetical protein ABIB43_02890 [archaeon]